jgi:hypothetical protein
MRAPLIRRVILDAAGRQKLPPGRIGFIDSLRWLANAREGDEPIVLAVIPLRPNRHEPRVKKYLIRIRGMSCARVRRLFGSASTRRRAECLHHQGGIFESHDPSSG